MFRPLLAPCPPRRSRQLTQPASLSPCPLQQQLSANLGCCLAAGAFPSLSPPAKRAALRLALLGVYICHSPRS